MLLLIPISPVLLLILLPIVLCFLFPSLGKTLGLYSLILCLLGGFYFLWTTIPQTFNQPPRAQMFLPKTDG
jgi:hypothetical protein